MSWLYSRALVGAFSAATCLGGAQSALSNTINTPQAFCLPDKMTAFSRLSRYGMTFAHLTEDLGEELLTWFLAGFHAKTFPVQEKALESTANDQASGQKWRVLLAKFDRDSCLWKTAQCSSIEDSDECLATFPRWGMTRNGELYQQQIPALRTSASVSGLMAKTGRNPKTNSTPDAVEFQPVETARKWPTPNASDHIQRKTSKSWAAKGRTNFVLSNPEVTGVEGGRLNPQWVEWLMGWPLGWTDLKPLAMDKFREWQRLHSPSWPNN